MVYKCKYCEAVYEYDELVILGYDDLEECPECGQIDPFDEEEEDD